MAARIDANINKETISFICSQIGISTTFLSQRTGLAEDQVRAWLDVSSDAFPTLNQAKLLAKALKIPFAGLYMNKDNLPIKKLPSLLNLRTLPYASSDNSSLNLAVVELIRYCDFLTSTEVDLGISPPILFLPSIPESVDVAECAAIIRTYFQLELNAQFKLLSPRQFYLYVRQKVENKGVFIHCFTGVDVEIVRAISIFNESTPIIGVNDKDRYPAKTFSIIHELVHILKRQSTLCNEMYASFSLKTEEIFCNAVAGEVLVPTASLNAILNASEITSFSLDDIDNIATKYRVSKEVVTRRLYDIKRISKDEYDTYANEIQQRFINERDTGNISRHESRAKSVFKDISRDAVDKTSSAICRALLIGYSDGYFSKQDVSGLLGIKEKHIPKFLAEVAKW